MGEVKKEQIQMGTPGRGQSSTRGRTARTTGKRITEAGRERRGEEGAGRRKGGKKRGIQHLRKATTLITGYAKQAEWPRKKGKQEKTKRRNIRGGRQSSGSQVRR